MWLGWAGILGGTLIALCSIGFYAANPALPTAEELASVGLLVAFELGALGVTLAQLLPRLGPSVLEPSPKRRTTSARRSMATVTVYRFRVFDPELQQWVTAPFRATEPAIQSFGGTALRETALSVDTSLVTPTGVERLKAREEAMRDALTAADAALKSAEPIASVAVERRPESPATAGTVTAAV